MSRKIKDMTFEVENEKGELEKLVIKIKELTVKQVKRLLFSATSTVKNKAIEREKIKKEKLENGQKEESKENPENEEGLLSDEEKEQEDNTNVMDSIFDIFGEEFKELFDLSISGVSWERLEDFTPSQIEELYDGFKEVNKVFFRVAQSMGIIEGVTRVLGSLKVNLLEEFANSFNSGIDTMTS